MGQRGSARGFVRPAGRLARATFWLAALPLALVASGCTGPAGPEPAPDGGADAAPQRGGTAVLGSISDIDSWNEYVSRQAFTNTVLRRVYLRLARERPGGGGAPDAFEPSLAESWTFSEDGLELTFRLREAEWSDGTPITAHDVRFTWQAQVAPEVPWISGSRKSAIEDVVVADERQVTFRFSRRYPYQLADAVEGGILPRHVFGEVPFSDWATHDWSDARVGSGPFLPDGHAPGERFRLTRNPRYRGDGPLLDAVVVRIVPDVAGLVMQIRAGEIDYVDGIAPREARRLEDDPQLTVIAYDRPGYDFIGWNAARPPFDDPEVRRALTLAIDRAGIVDDLLYGYGRVSKGPLVSFWSAADPTVEPLPYDPAAARELLEARGIAGGAAAAALAGNASPLRFELLTNAGNALREDVLVKIQEQLSRIGVEVVVRPMEMRAMRQRVASGDFDAYLGGWVYDVPDLRTVFASDATFPAGGNVVAYASPEADRLLDAFDRAERWEGAREAMQALHRRIHADQPYTFLYESRRLAVHGPRLRGVVIDVPADPLAHLEHFWIR